MPERDKYSIQIQCQCIHTITGEFRWMKSSTRASTIHLQPKKPPVLGYIKRSLASRSKRWLSPSAPTRLHSQYCVLPRGTQHQKARTCLSECRGGLWRWSEGWSTSSTKDKLRKLRLYSLERKRLWRHLRADLSVLKENLQESFIRESRLDQE